MRPLRERPEIPKPIWHPPWKLMRVMPAAYSLGPNDVLLWFHFPINFTQQIRTEGRDTKAGYVQLQWIRQMNGAWLRFLLDISLRLAPKKVKLFRFSKPLSLTATRQGLHPLGTIASLRFGIWQAARVALRWSDIASIKHGTDVRQTNARRQVVNSFWLRVFAVHLIAMRQ